MDLGHFDDSKILTNWIADERNKVTEYLNQKRIIHSGVFDEPAWYVAPLVAIWPVFSLESPADVGWWAISGDVPTDHISANDVPDAKAAMSEFSKRWLELSEYMLRGEPHPDVQMGSPDEWPELGDLLFRRAKMLAELVEGSGAWQRL